MGHFLFLSYITAFQLLPYSYYNPYNASALITPQTAFPKIMFFFLFLFFFKLHELLHWMISLFVMRSPLETKEFAEQIISFQSCGARLAQWVKHWPVGLAVPSSSPARGGIFTTVNGDLLHTAFRYQFFSS